MILIACIDDKGGMGFNRRRQSRDRVLCARVLELAQGKTLWMSSYSAGQFGAEVPGLRVDDACLDRAAPGEFCFAEAGPLAPCAPRVEELVLFRWNRVYPADSWFDIPLEDWTLARREDFAGSSHETITMEVYTR